MPVVYATSEQLSDYLPEGEFAPADSGRLLVRASELIVDYTRTAVYDTDDAGFPTEVSVRTALADATCAQVEYWMHGEEEEDILGPLVAAGVASQQLQYGQGSNRSTPMYLAPRAARHLASAGLMYGGVGSLR